MKPAMTAIKQKQIGALRDRLYRRMPSRRVQTPREAGKFVEEVGFCLFWPIKGIEMPNLFHAIAGRVRAVPTQHDDPDISKCWNWKDQALGQRKWYYGKLLGKRATLVSMEYLPLFYALSPNFGGEDDYVQDYEAGLLSREAKNVYEALHQHGPLDTVRLRRESRLAAESAKTAFERALVELQVTMRILPVGVAEAGAWRYAFIYDLVPRHFPRLAEDARPITRGQARTRLVARHLDNVVAASQAEIVRVFGVLKWTPHELEKTLTALVERRMVIKIPVEGMKGEQIVSLRALRSVRSRH
jgi:hypothetical protein